MTYVFIAIGILLFFFLFLIVKEIIYQRRLNKALVDGRFDEVFKSFKDRVEENDSFAAISLLRLAGFYIIAGRPDEARKSVYTALEGLLPAKLNTEAFILLSNASFLKGELKQAFKEGMRALKFCEETRVRKFVLDSLILLTKIQIELGYFDKASQCLEKVAKIDPCNLQIPGIQGTMEFARGNFTESLGLLNQSLLRLKNVQPTYLKLPKYILLNYILYSLDGLTWIHIYQDRNEVALSLLQESVDIWAGNEQCQIIPRAKMAVALSTIGDKDSREKAHEEMKKSSDLMNRYEANKWINSRFYLLKGIYLERIGEYKDAEETLIIASKQGEFPLISLAALWHRAQTLEKMGEEKMAENSYRRVLESGLSCYYTALADKYFKREKI